MSDFDALFFPLCILTGTFWLLLLFISIGGRALAQWRCNDLATAQRVLRDLQFQGTSSEAQKIAMQNFLRRLPRRVLDRVASDASLPVGAAAIFSAHVLSRSSIEVLLRDATQHRRGIRKWRRISALRVLAHAFCENAFDERIFDLLRDAVYENDHDVADAAVAILGNMHHDRAAQVLVEALQQRASSPQRIAAQLDDFPGEHAGLLLPLLKDENAVTRRWTAMLLARYNDHTEVPAHLAELAHDPDADVRSAVITSLGYLASPPSRMRRPVHVPREELRRRTELVAKIASELLQDGVWFVRAQAARTLGELKKSEFAHTLTPLLSDPQWWVRQAAKDALQAIGSGAAPSIIEALESPDRFARNGAAEVLQNTGIVYSLVNRMAQAPQADAADLRLLRKIYNASGEALVAAALRDVPEAQQAELWRVIRKVPESTQSGGSNNSQAHLLNAQALFPQGFSASGSLRPPIFHPRSRKFDFRE